MSYCFTKELADRLQKALRDGKIDIQKLYDMTSQQRRKFFTDITDADAGVKINTAFETAMVSTQKDALKRWAVRTFGDKQTKKRAKSVEEKINRLDELGLLTDKNADNFLYDLVATQLGMTVTPEEAGKINTLAQDVQKKGEQLSEFGTPTLEYFQSKKKLEDYMDSITPSSRLKVATSTIGRGTMLFSIKSPLVNIESNTIQAILTGAERRFLNKQIAGANGTYANEYMKFVNKVYDKTGYDLSRMQSLDDIQRVRGEEVPTTQGEGKIRKIGRFYEDIVFKKLMGKPDVVFSAFHFSDSANLASTKIAKQEGLKGKALEKRALQIFKDATKLNPATPQGLKVREQAIADAEYATYTNQSRASNVALGIRKVLNEATGDIRLGDQLMPFVKTPANVVQAGIDYSGMLLPFDTALRSINVIQKVRKGDTFNTALQESFDGYLKSAVRAGIGITLSHILASMFDPEDFIGEYPVSQKERELLELQNATPNSVRIGDKWISLDYFGALGTPFVSLMYAKKYGTNTWTSVFNYYVGGGRQLAKIPGLEVGVDVFDLLRKTKFGEGEDVKKSAVKGTVSYLRARTIPAFIYDIAKATDEYERRIDKDEPMDIIKFGIPTLRQQVNPRINVFGETVKSEGFISTMLFGSRVKTANRTEIVREMERLQSTNNLPSLTDYAITSDRMEQLKEQIGAEKFQQARQDLGAEITARFTRTIKSSKYKRATDEDKAKLLNDQKEEALDRTLRKYRYRKPK